MTDALLPTDQDPRRQPIDEDLDFADGDLPDDEPEVVEGLEQLRMLRVTEDESVLELHLPARSERSSE